MSNTDLFQKIAVYFESSDKFKIKVITTCISRNKSVLLLHVENI